MARDDVPPTSPADLLSWMENAADKTSVDDLRRALFSQSLVGELASDPTSYTPPNLRRPRSPTHRTYRVRIDVRGAKPPIWRRVDLSSHLLLNEVHDVIQAAFGWTDSHLHIFGLGASVWDREAEVYVCPFHEETDGVPEEEVRLDEVLVDVGDKLLYVYDFGDDWEHTIVLEEVRAAGDAPPAVCINGRRAGPLDDSGGIHGYTMLLASAADPNAEDHADAVDYLGWRTGGDFDPAHFDVAEANTALAAAMDRAALTSNPLLAPVLIRLRGLKSESAVLDLVRDAQLDEPSGPTAGEVDATTRKIGWILRRVGDDGIKLTGAGYLPPVDVEACMAELEMFDDWIGKGNREDLTPPVRALRELTRELGLVRKYKGRLMLTKAGRRVRDDDGELWDHIAGRLLAYEPDSAEQHVAVLALLTVAAGGNPRSAEGLDLIIDALSDLGWRLESGEPVHGDSVVRGAGRTVFAILDETDSFVPREVGERPHDSPPSSSGVALARSALR